MSYMLLQIKNTATGGTTVPVQDRWRFVMPTVHARPVVNLDQVCSRIGV